MKKRMTLTFIAGLAVVAVVYFNSQQPISLENLTDDEGGLLTQEILPTQPHPLSIEALREQEYPGSDITIEEMLNPGSNYQRYRVSYLSEGEARGGYGNNDYTIDVLNGMSSVQAREDVDASRIGMWGHSMGGHITLESMVVRDDIKVGVIWAGVVGSYQDLFTVWHSSRNRNIVSPIPTPSPNGRGWWRYQMQEEHGTPEENSNFWDSLSSTSYLSEISGPVQLHHGTADSSVEVELSQILEDRLQEEGKTVESYEYQGDDHNISQNLGVALQRSVDFFDLYLKE